MIRYLIYITILFIPAYIIKVSLWGIPTNVLECFVFLTFAVYLVEKKNERSFKKFYEDNRAIIFSFAAVLAGLLISMIAGGNYQTGLGIIKGWFLAPILFSWIIYANIKKMEDVRGIISCLYIGILGVAVISLGYYFTGKLTFDGRLSAFYLSPNHLAMYLAPGIIIGVWRLVIAYNNKKKINKKLLALFFSLIPLLIAFYFTYSYAAWGAVALGLAITHLMKNKKIKKEAFLIGLIIFLLIVISQWNTEKFENLREYSRSSFESRIMIWKSSVKILEDNILFGIGPGNFQNKYLEYQKYFPPYLEWAVPQPHNLYLAFWLQTGIIGLAGFIMLIIWWTKKQIGVLKKQKSGLSSIAAVLLAIFLYFLIHGLVDTPYWKNDLAFIFWIIVFLGIKISKSDFDSI